MKHSIKKILYSAAALLVTAALCAGAVIIGGRQEADPDAPVNAAADTTPNVTARAAASLAITPLLNLTEEEKVGGQTQKNAPDAVANDAAANDDTAANDTAVGDDGAEAEAVSPAVHAKPVYIDTGSVSAVGIVGADRAYLRASGSEDSDVIGELESGALVSVLGQADGWSKIQYDGMIAYLSADCITTHTSVSGLSAYGRVETDDLTLRAQPAGGSAALGTVGYGSYVALTGFEGGWYAVSCGDTNGYMHADYLSPTMSQPSAYAMAALGAEEPATYSEETYAETYEEAPAAAYEEESSYVEPPASTVGGSIAETALGYLGCPYSYGGASPSGFDCSGFTMYVYALHGYSLPHGATDQLYYGYAVDWSDLQAGDLVFFYDSDYDPAGTGGATHVGIYIGGGQFVHATSGWGSGVIVSDLGGYYGAGFCGARRLG